MFSHYTATEAAEVLGLEYHTFLARVRRGKYPFDRFGMALLFDKSTIDKAAKEEGATFKPRKKREGVYHSPTYRSWKSMMSRCYSSNSDRGKYWKEKGVIVCERWHNFQKFLEDMGERPKGKTLDRYPNPSGNYEPGNVRWATPKEQMNNLRNKAQCHAPNSQALETAAR